VPAGEPPAGSRRRIGRQVLAKFWASEGGHRVVYAAQHLHGGIGVDVDYPIHRYYLSARQIELTLGGAEYHLERLGNLYG